MDYVVRGDEWALDDYYEALDIRNDDLRWVLSDAQYRRFLGAEYFYRPIYVTGGRWSFRIYTIIRIVVYSILVYLIIIGLTVVHIIVRIFINVSYYRGRYNNLVHYPTPYRVRGSAGNSSYRRSDFGSVRFRPNTSVRPHNAPTDRVLRDVREQRHGLIHQDVREILPVLVLKRTIDRPPQADHLHRAGRPLPEDLPTLKDLRSMNDRLFQGDRPLRAEMINRTRK